MILPPKDTSQHTVQLLLSSRVTPFYFEVDLNEFGIDDLERGLKFAEPSKVLELCRLGRLKNICHHKIVKIRNGAILYITVYYASSSIIFQYIS